MTFTHQLAFAAGMAVCAAIASCDQIDIQLGILWLARATDGVVGLVLSSKDRECVCPQV